MASLTDGIGQSIIASLPRPPDVTAAEGNGITGFFSGFMGGMNVGKKHKASKEAGGPGEGGLFERLAKGYLNAPGEAKKGADPNFDINTTIKNQQAQMNTLQIEQFISQREQTVQAEAALSQFGKILNSGINGGVSNEPWFKSEVGNFIARNPGIRKQPMFKDMMNDLLFSQKTHQQMQAIEQSRGEGMVPSQTTIRDEAGVTRTFEQAPVSEEERARIARESNLVPTGVSPEGIKLFGRPFQNSTEEIRDAEGNVILRRTTGGDLGQLTTSQAGNITQTLSKLGSGIDRVSEIIPNVESIFGPANMLGEVIVDRTLSNVFPEMAEGQRIEGRQLFRTFRESMFKGLSEGEGRLSDQDVDRLRALFPKENTLIESPENAKIQLQTFRQELGREIAEKAKLTGAPIPQKALVSMSPKTLTLMFQNGEITEEQFKIGWDQNVNTEQKRAFIKQLQNAKR